MTQPTPSASDVAVRPTRIEFNRPDGDPHMWEILVRIPKDKIVQLTDDLEKRGLLPHFVAHMRPVTLASKHVFLMFELVDEDPQTNFRVIRALLRLLWVSKLDIVWKEGGYGYRIDAHGHVKQRWMLTRPYRPLHNQPTE